jgi:hypothetical protein
MSGQRNHRSGGHLPRDENAPKNSTPEQLDAINRTLKDFIARREERLNAPLGRREKWKFRIEVSTLASLAIYTLITLGLYSTSRSTESYQLRAYLHPIIDRKPVDLTKNPLDWTYVLTNYGSTPACHVRTSGQLYVGPMAFALVDRPPPEAMHYWGIEPNFCVAPHEEHEVKLFFADRRNLSPEEKSMIEKGQTTFLYSHGTIFYDDIFGNPHETYYKTYLGGPDMLASSKMEWTPNGNFTDDNLRSTWQRFKDFFVF